MSGVERIAAERERQIEIEKYDASHDDGEKSGQLIDAACCYLPWARCQVVNSDPDCFEVGNIVRDTWPWSTNEFRPSAHLIRNLEKAAARKGSHRWRVS